MKKGTLPFKRLIFVCTNKREPGERISCAGNFRDGEKILEALKAAVKTKGVSSDIRVVRSVCLEQCEKGPAAFVYPSGECLYNLELSDLPELISSYLNPPSSGDRQPS
jgi:(2Fe-2S) ferredoxin